jgi:hypothetical protein
MAWEQDGAHQDSGGLLLIFTLMHHEQNKSSYSASISSRILSIAAGAVAHLELDVTLPFDKGSVPRHFSLSARELSKELGMRVAVNLHALLAAIGIALIGVEEAIGSISHHLSPLQVQS